MQFQFIPSALNFLICGFAENAIQRSEAKLIRKYEPIRVIWRRVVKLLKLPLIWPVRLIGLGRGTLNAVM